MTTRNTRPHAYPVQIVATGHYYPKDVVDNDEFFKRARFHVTDDRDALVRDSRMKTRRWCAEGENTWTMAREAVRMAVETGDVKAEEIDLVLVSSCSTMPRVHYPNPDNPVVADLAPLVLQELGRENGVGIDIKATYCAGFLRALEIMDGMLQDSRYRAGLIVASDVGGRFATGESNRSAFCFSVGDAAGAAILRRLEPGKRRGLVDSCGRLAVEHAGLTSWGADGESLFVRSRTGETSLALLIESARELFDRNDLTPNDIDWLVPMQTHPGVLDALCEALEFPREKLIWKGDEVGYAASAAIPARFSAARHEGIISPGDLVLSLAVGAGMNSAGALFYA